MQQPEQRLWWWRPLGWVVAGCALGVGLLAADATIDRERADVERRDGAAVARIAVDLADRASSTLRTLRVQGGTIALDPALAELGPPAGASTVAVAVVGAGGIELEVETGAMPPEVASSDAVAAAAGAARDDGRAVLAAPVAASQATVFVIPIYETGAGRATELPGATTTQRRAAWAGAVLLQVDVEALLPAEPAAVRVSDGDAALGARGPFDGDAVGLSVPIAARRWLVEVPAGTSGTPPLAVVAVLLGLAAAIAVLLLERSARGMSRRAGIRADAMAHHAGTVRRLAPILQQSPDLGDVLPAVAVLLGEELHVDGFALATYGGDGSLREVFTSGWPIGPGPSATSDVESLGAGDTLALALRRADRDVALLRIRASEALGPLELESLRTAAELLAAALISAQAFERQEAAMLALRQVDELKNVFLGVASHELRTPVTAIGGFARLLSDRWEQLPDDQRRNLAVRIQANAAALGVLVQDLLDFSRLERGRFVVDSESVDLAGRVEAVVDRLGPIWGGRPVEVVIDDRPIVAGDGDALERVAANLLSNAAKFSPEGAPIVAGVSVADGVAVLRVDDAGPGVPEEERAHIYSAFFRGRGDAVVRTRGAGIGLSVVKEIVEQMGGSISVGSSPAGGARFEVRLPLDGDRPAAGDGDEDQDEDEDEHQDEDQGVAR